MHRKTTLDNGLRVITASMPSTRSAAIGVFVQAGSRHEADRHAGAAHFIEHVLFKGTRDFPVASDISNAIEGVGGFLNGGTDREMTVYWCKVPDQHFPMAWHVLSDMVRHPIFDAEEIEKERNVIIEEINMSLDSPPQQVDLLSDSMVWPGHPLGRDIAGSRESVAALSRDDLLEVMRTGYGPQNVVVSIAGNITHDAALQMVGAAFGDWARGADAPQFRPAQAVSGPGMRVTHRDIEQANLVLALPAISVQHPDRFAYDLFNVVFGEGSVSRLFLEIREKLGLTYSIQSHAQYYLDSGALNIAAAADPENLTQLVSATIAELVKLKDGVTAAELDRAREICKGRLLLRLEDSRNVSGWLGSQEVLTEEILTPDDIVAKIEAVSVEDIERIIRLYIQPDQLHLAVVGPVREEAELRRLIGLK